MTNEEDFNKIVKFIDETVQEINNGVVDDLCDEVSQFVCVVLEENGYHCLIAIGEFKTHEKEYHAWNIVDGECLDLTISQFGNFKNGIIKDSIYKKYYKKFDEEKMEEDEEVTEKVKKYIEKFNEKIKINKKGNEK